MASPSNFYHNPLAVLLADERGGIKRSLGCAACRHRGERVFDRYLCGLPERQPGPLGFCKLWKLR